MKIMFVLGSMGKGGAERVIANLSNNFIQKYQVTIVTTRSCESMYKLDDRINVLLLDQGKKKKSLIFRTLKRIFRLRKIIKTENPDIIVSLLPEPTFRAMIAKAFLHKKTIISVRNDPNREYNSLIKKILVKVLYTRADGFIFQTDDAKKWFSKKIQNKSTIIPNPINEDFICTPYNGKREKTIVNVGRLSDQKNQQLLIEAFAEVHKKHSDYILKIYGDGVLKPELEDLISKLNISEGVKLMGETNNVKGEIQKAGIFVLSSNYEGMPNALIEAMALGIPCISTDCPCGGPKFLFDNEKRGLLFPVGDKESLIKSIELLINNSDKAKELSIEGRKIVDVLNPTTISNKWEEYILRIKRGDDK